MTVQHSVISSPEVLFDEVRNGRMVILVDDEIRDGTGALILPAQMVTPNAINFMAANGRGLVCLALTKARADQLGLSPLNAERSAQTAFTASIEARDGVSTGISAADRARTIAVAVDAFKTSDDLVTPGHVFPIIAREGGVLVRAGHAEAAVDLARLAGLNPSGVVCEIMNDNGEMARLDDLVALGAQYNIHIGALRDLIAYRRRHDHIVEKVTETQFSSVWGGNWCAKVYRNTATGSEQIALVKGTLNQAGPVLVRMHALSPLADLFGEASTQATVLAKSMSIIDRAGAGVIVVLAGQQGGGALVNAIRQKAGAAAELPSDDLRDYGVGAMILAELGVHQMILLTNTPRNPVGLEGYGLSIVGTQPFTDPAPDLAHDNVERAQAMPVAVAS